MFVIHMSKTQHYFCDTDGLVQDCSLSSVVPMEIL